MAAGRLGPAGSDPVGPMETLALGMVETAGDAVTLAIGLIGVMTFFLGLMKVAEAGGLLRIIAKTIRPLMVRLFPDIPHDHPAMGAMILNMSANALGLGNAATPFGIRAMQELDRLNPHKGTASDAMVLFLAINTSSVTLLPTGVIALRAAAGSSDPAGSCRRRCSRPYARPRRRSWRRNSMVGSPPPRPRWPNGRGARPTAGTRPSRRGPRSFHQSIPGPRGRRARPIRPGCRRWRWVSSPRWCR